MYLFVVATLVLGICGCGNKTNDAENVGSVNTEEIVEEQATAEPVEEVITDKQKEYDNKYSDDIKKLLGQISSNYADSSFVIKKIIIDENNGTLSDIVVDIYIKGTISKDGNEKLVYYGYAVYPTIGMFDEDVPNETKEIEEFFAGEREVSDDVVWEVDEENGIIRRVIKRYSLDDCYVLLCNPLNEKYQEYYNALYE